MIASRMIWFTNFTTDASGSSAFRSVLDSTVLRKFERAIGFENLVERFRADAVERFHRAQDLAARHEHPFGRFLQIVAWPVAVRRN